MIGAFTRAFGKRLHAADCFNGVICLIFFLAEQFFAAMIAFFRENDFFHNK